MPDDYYITLLVIFTNYLLHLENFMMYLGTEIIKVSTRLTLRFTELIPD